MNEEEMVSAGVVIQRFKMPPATFYWLVKRGDIPKHLAPREPWHRRPRYLFRLSEVQEALDDLTHRSQSGLA